MDYAHLTGRLYASTKTNSFSFTDSNTGSELVYRSNNQVNLGFGASYQAFTLNIGIGFKFLNRDDEAKGSTEYFDAQGNMFGRKRVVNLFFQTYKGYYIDGRSEGPLGWDVPMTVPYRGDIRQVQLRVQRVCTCSTTSGSATGRPSTRTPGSGRNADFLVARRVPHVL